MPELPEVETVKETLKHQVIDKVIENVFVYHNNVVEYPNVEDFIKQLKQERIIDIKRRGKWILFELNHYYLLSHLRMEGKYFIRNEKEEKMKHELVNFVFTDGSSLRYHDTRKFGKMHLVDKELLMDYKIMKELGLEPWDLKLTQEYLNEHYKNKKIPIKTVLLDQKIIVGIGNIYANEILFLSNIHPLKECSSLTKKERENIILNTRKVLLRAIQFGGTTVKSFTSSEGIHGLFQNELFVHEQIECRICKSNIIKIKIGGRGTYYCPKCQKGKKYERNLSKKKYSRV